MLKATCSKKMGIVVLGIILGCSTAVVAVAERVITKKIIIQEGPAKQEITITNGQVAADQCTTTDGQPAKHCFKDNTSSNLVLIDTKGTADPDDDTITPLLANGVPDDTMIKCDSPIPSGDLTVKPMGPGCVWYFFAGRWWLVCQ